MAIVFITGSADGLGRAAAQSLLDRGHQVVLHARSADRARVLGELCSRAAGVAIGDLRNATETRNVADHVNAIGRMDAVIHKCRCLFAAERRIRLLHLAGNEARESVAYKHSVAVKTGTCLLGDFR